LEFDITLIPYTGDDSWIEKTLFAALKCLQTNKLPASGEDCDYCRYREAAISVSEQSLI